MKRFEWSTVVELEPGVTYIPSAITDDGRSRMVNCRCWYAPIFKEDIEGEKVMVNSQQLQQKQ